MEYINYLTTPSGRYCQVKDISNGDYLILVKYLQSQNFSKFFECLDVIVKRSIPNLDQFDIVQRCYVYIAMCMYSIRGTISVNNVMLGTQEISLALILNNIESCYTRDFIVQYQLKDGVILKFGYPKKFEYQNEIPSIDYFSGLIGYNDVILSQEQKLILKKKLDTKTLMFIDDFLRNKCISMCDIFHGVPMNKFQFNLFNQSIIVNVLSFYKMPLESFYSIMYAMIKHLRMSYSDFLKINHLQTTIMMNYAIEQNAKINEQSKKGNVGSIGKMIEDAS